MRYQNPVVFKLAQPSRLFFYHDIDVGILDTGHGFGDNLDKPFTLGLDVGELGVDLAELVGLADKVGSEPSDVVVGRGCKPQFYIISCKPVHLVGIEAVT